MSAITPILLQASATPNLDEALDMLALHISLTIYNHIGMIICIIPFFPSSPGVGKPCANQVYHLFLYSLQTKNGLHTNK